MPELGSLGTVRGALGNERPYREHQPLRRFSPAVGIWARPIETGSGSSPNGEVSGRRVQSSRDSYECAQRFFSMP